MVSILLSKTEDISSWATYVRKIARIRELRGMKQETLAEEMGISQQSVSHIEQSETIEEDLLQRVSKALGVSPEGIKRFSEEAVINYFNNFQDNSEGTFNNHCTFNPIDKVVELYWYRPRKIKFCIWRS